MPALDLQRKGYQNGRIRIGRSVDTGRKDRSGNAIRRPVKLNTFLFTTASQRQAEAVAGLYGGTVQPWERRSGHYEVATPVNVIGVTIPPRDEVISQWYEMWSKGGAARRCDSQIEKLSGKPCLCPHAINPDDPDEVDAAARERARLAKMMPPQACRLITRMSLMLPDLPGIGVWRVDTHSFYAAGAVLDSAETMTLFRERGMFLPAELRVEEHEEVSQGQTKKYPQIALDLLDSFRALATGAVERGGIVAQLPPAPTTVKAIEAAPAPAVEAPQAKPVRAEQVTAQGLADQAAKATTRAEIEDLATLASGEELLEDSVNTGDDAYEELDVFLKHRWKTLPRTPEDEDAAARKDGAA
jgi:hypothetical protein